MPMPWPESTPTHRSHQKVSAPPPAEVQPGGLRTGGGQEVVPCTVDGSGSGRGFRVSIQGQGQVRVPEAHKGGQQVVSVSPSLQSAGARAAPAWGLPMLGSSEREAWVQLESRPWLARGSMCRTSRMGRGGLVSLRGAGTVQAGSSPSGQCGWNRAGACGRGDPENGRTRICAEGHRLT